MRAKSAANDNIIIDSEFAALIPPLLEEEHIQLLVNIVGDGCHEPLSIWDNDSKHVLIDGHNRLRYLYEEPHPVYDNASQVRRPRSRKGLDW